MYAQRNLRWHDDVLLRWHRLHRLRTGTTLVPTSTGKSPPAPSTATATTTVAATARAAYVAESADQTTAAANASCAPPVAALDAGPVPRETAAAVRLLGPRYDARPRSPQTSQGRGYVQLRW